MNIAIGKIGKSLLFGQHKWGMIGGDHEAPALMSSLAQMNPNITFYILGRSDWKKLDIETKEKINVNNNIVDIWETYDKNIVEETHWPNTYFKKFDITIDYALIMSGPAGASSITEAMWTIDETRVAKPSEMFRRYVGPITRFLNDSGVPYSELGEDPRYVPCAARDLFNRPDEILTTRDVAEGNKIKHIKEYMSKELLEYTIPMKNFNVDKLFMMSEPDKRLKEPGERKNLISVYSNGLTDTGGEKKYPGVKSYILDNFPTATIYGQWPEEQLEDEEHKHKFIPTPMAELVNQMYDTKYSFMIPIKKGWPSSKYWKHLLFGMLPFFHPYSDEDRTSSAPDFFYLKSPEDFKEKVEYLENNPAEYIKMWHQCQDLLLDSYFDGTFYNTLLLNKIGEKLGKDMTQFLNSTKSIEYKMSCLYPLEPAQKTNALF